ncbi:unnamed protein product [Adineta ricciae]|uniref:Uncharacterized protein n=1 Tax=Adineta ricciae TaxID=249248 RepID=A0A815M851_ADIRI|nr:unnamed protein product [Adineta ricciae]
MKNEYLQKVVFRKYEDGGGLTKIFRDPNRSLGLNTIKRWCKMIRDTGCIQLSTTPGAPCLARTRKTIRKVKHKLDRKKTVSARSSANDYGISKSSVHRILTGDLGLYAYKVRSGPKLTDQQRKKRKEFVNWIDNSF